MAIGSSARLQVLLLAKGLGPGGMERLLVHHVGNGDRDRFDYSVAYLVDRPASLVKDFRELGAECVQLKARSVNDPRWSRDLSSLVSRKQIDIVHSHSPLVASIARLTLGLRRGAPRLVYTEHNTWDCYGASTRSLNAATYLLDDAQFAVSADAKSSVPVLLSRKVEVLTHGIDLGATAAARDQSRTTRAQLGIADDEIVITNVAHLRTEKAQQDLLRAAATLIAAHQKVVVLSVGHGPRRAELQQLHDDLGLGDRFRFLGFRNDAQAILAASDVFCLASHQEGLPLALMEAMALGLPVVSTSVGGIPDHLRDGVSGFLVRAGDVGSLSCALSRLVVDPDLRSVMGAEARRAASVFDARVAVARQEQVYLSLTQSGAAYTSDEVM